ncbi:MAG: hypothetical protein ACK5UI_07875 [Bacteroidota bacterium]|jgi:hypothetical protein
MSLPLADKNVLVFAPKFFGYEIKISEKLKALGANVHFYDERPANTFWTKAFIRINRNLVKSSITNYYNQILKQTAQHQFDYVFVVNLEAMTPEIVDALRNQQKQAKFLLYMWDSLQNKNSALMVFKKFDYCYSFDKSDALKFPELKFRPLFFIDEYDCNLWPAKPAIQYDLCFIGTVHSDRYKLIKTIQKKAISLQCRVYFYLYFHNPILFFYKKIRDVKFYDAKFSEFHFTPLHASDIAEIIKQSNAIVDIQHPKQSGLTMRTLEMLGAGKKLITTNTAIVEYDFYNPNNIAVISRDNPELNAEFLHSAYQEVDQQIKWKYSIEGWLYEIFMLNKS